MMGEIGATAGWAMFNLMLATGMVREAAALTTQIGGRDHPVGPRRHHRDGAA